MRGSRRRFLIWCIAALVLPRGVGAQAFDPVGLIGLDPASALKTLGPPFEVFSYRGVEEAEDNVVFFYPDFTYLFWFRNRVWQVRCDQRFKGAVFGLKLGMRRDEVGAAAEWAQTEIGDSVYFDFIKADYPIRVRLVFSGGILHDVYVYRSDY